jgi:hypothetical protein
MRYWFLVFLILATASQVAQADATSDEGEVVRIADRYLREHFPQDTHVFDLERKVVDRGESWIVYYLFPLYSSGIAPEVYIEKRTKRVSKVLWSQ